jgi:hypothetical protein
MVATSPARIRKTAQPETIGSRFLA